MCYITQKIQSLKNSLNLLWVTRNVGYAKYDYVCWASRLPLTHSASNGVFIKYIIFVLTFKISLMSCIVVAIYLKKKIFKANLLNWRRKVN